jgi:hypothetical protein
MRIKSKSAQALMEMALGMLALSLVVSALVAFSSYIAKGLEIQHEARSQAGVSAVNSSSSVVSFSSSARSADIEVDRIAAEYIFGEQRIKIKEEVNVPKAGILIE